MEKIDRHPAVSYPGMVERKLSFIEKAKFPASATPGALSSLLQSALNAVSRASLDENSLNELKKALKAAARAAAGLYAIETGPGEKVTLRWIDDTSCEVPTKIPTSMSGPAFWRYGFYCALAARDDWALDVLAGSSVDKIRVSIKADECAFLHIEAIQAYRRRDASAPEKILDALRATDPDRIHPTAVDYTLHILVPEMDLLFQLMRRDHSDFMNALEKAIVAHKGYYTTGEMSRDIFGQIAWGPLGLCCLARDAGWSIDVRSGYIPESVIFS